MNIIQSQLTSQEQDLIRLALDFLFDFGITKICLNDISLKIELDLSKPDKIETEKIDIKQLEKLKQKLEIQTDKAKNSFYSFSKKLWDSRESLSEEKQEEIRSELNRSEILWGKLSNSLQSVEEAIDSGCIVQTSLLGSFCSSEKKVYLYLDSINHSAKWTKRGIVLITTFIHEMFHAWNFYACGERERTIREIDEAMVEFATLCFLKQISQVHGEFDPILEWAEQSVKKKQTALGKMATYGYGYYLYSLIGGQEEKNAIDMLSAYADKSGTIQDSTEVRKAKAMLNPCYPFDKERDAFVLLYQIIFPGVTLRLGISQRQQVINALRQLGGYARLEDLYNSVDTSTWATKTPKASIRRILQSSKDAFMIEHGFWGLEECREQIEDKIKSRLSTTNKMP